jgi:hypothetical protein
MTGGGSTSDIEQPEVFAGYQSTAGAVIDLVRK